MPSTAGGNCGGFGVTWTDVAGSGFDAAGTAWRTSSLNPGYQSSETSTTDPSQLGKIEKPVEHSRAELQGVDGHALIDPMKEVGKRQRRW